MQYWLVKSEPFKYSFDQLLKDKKTFWDGVRNYAARNNLRSMAKGDLILFYHSNEGLEIVGLAEVARTAYQDPSTEDGNWVAIDLKPKKKFKQAVTLATIKAHPVLSAMQLVRLSRLSVSAVTPEEFEIIVSLSEG